jgi:tRNA nucleotidyltransferase (CCA-adding enzyme)
MPVVDAPPAPELLQRLRTLPAFEAIATALGERPGIYVAGGAVRDLLLGGHPADLDLVVEGETEAVAAELGPAVTHERFGTSTVNAAGFTYDLARARTETYAHPGALPEVAPATLAEDLLRRDFTVNAMAIAIGPPEPGRLHAAPNAIEDLAERRLRVLHDTSFIDDPTRLLRLVRYASRLGFAVEHRTLQLAQAAADGRALSTVSGPRIGAELRLLARESDPVAAFERLAALHLDVAVHPALRLEDPPLLRRALALLPEDGRPDRLVLAATVRRIQRDELRALLDGLEFEAGDREAIVAAAVGAGALADALRGAPRPSVIAATVGGGGPELVALAGAIGPAAAASEWLERLRHVTLEIDGTDLLAAGVAEGPAVGAGLRAALDAKLDGAADDREQQLQIALHAALSR